VQWLVVRHGLRLVGAGLLIGVAGALVTTRAMQALLFRITAADPATFVSVGVLLLVTTAAASWLPARRASLADPASTLRDE
jgi:ABC-type lipoprotein release transport system permease subunit